MKGFVAESDSFNSVVCQPDERMHTGISTLKVSNKPADDLSLSGTARLIDYSVGLAPDAIKFVSFGDFVIIKKLRENSISILNLES